MVRRVLVLLIILRARDPQHRILLHDAVTYTTRQVPVCVKHLLTIPHQTLIPRQGNTRAVALHPPLIHKERGHKPMQLTLAGNSVRNHSIMCATLSHTRTLTGTTHLNVVKIHARPVIPEHLKTLALQPVNTLTTKEHGITDNQAHLRQTKKTLRRRLRSLQTQNRLHTSSSSGTRHSNQFQHQQILLSDLRPMILLSRIPLLPT